MLKSRNLLWIIPIILLLCFPLWKVPIASFLEPRGGYDPNFGKQDRNVHNFIMDKVLIIQDQSGHKTAIVKADKAYTTDTPNEFQLDRVDAELFNEDNDKVNVTAEEGVYNTDTKKLTLKRRVHVVRESENQNLYTELLYYHDDTRTIESPSATRLVGENIEIAGGNLTYDIATNQYALGNRVKCTIQGFQ